MVPQGLPALSISEGHSFVTRKPFSSVYFNLSQSQKPTKLELASKGGEEVCLGVRPQCWGNRGADSLNLYYLHLTLS